MILLEPDQTVVDVDHPWPGLASFREQDEHYFKGREPDIEKLRTLVNRERLTVLFGVSGLGKSSLLQAGLFPRLRSAQIFPVYIRLDFAAIGAPLREQVFSAVARQAQDNAIEAPAHTENETLWEYFHRKDAELWDARNRIVIPLLCFDQFEEIFTLGRENPQRAQEVKQFITELADLVEGRCPEMIKAHLDDHPEEAKIFSFTRHPYKVVLSLREDYLADLEGLRKGMPSLVHNRMRLAPMRGDQALAVADQTQGRLMATSVAESIVRLVAGKRAEESEALSELRIEPALLSLVCRELNERRIAAHAKQIDAQSVASSREQILEDFYERSLENESSALRWFIEDKLITINGLFRNSEAFDNALETPGITQEALFRLVLNRLLRLEERNGVRRIELIHDVLTGIVRKSRDQRWALEKQRQAEVERKKAEDAFRTSKRRALLYLIMMGIALSTSIWGWWSWWDAKEARSKAQQALITANRALAVTDFREALHHIESQRVPEALAHLARAVRVDPAWLSSRSLLISLLQQRKWVLPQATFRDVSSAVFSTDDTRVLTTSDKIAQLRDARTGQSLGKTMHHDEYVRSAVFSADSMRIVTASGKTVQLWDAHTGQPLGKPMRHEYSVWSTVFSADGTRVLTVSGADTGPYWFEGAHTSTKTIRLWDAHTGQPLGAAIQHKGDFVSAVLSANGERVLTTSPTNAQLWDARTGQSLGETMQHQGESRSAAFSADSTRIVTVSGKTVQLWDACTGQFLGEPMRDAKGDDLVVSSADGTRVVTVYGGAARLWDALTGQPLGEPIQHKENVRSAVFSADGTRVLMASEDKTALLLWDVRTGQALGKPMRHKDKITSAVFSADGTRVMTVSGVDANSYRFEGERAGTKTIQLWNARTGQPLGEPIEGGDSAVMSTDGKHVLTVSGGAALLWDVRTGQSLGEPIQHKEDVRSAVLSADGTRVLTVSGKAKAVQLWDARTGQPLGEPIQHKEDVRSAVLSADGTRVLTVSGKAEAVQLWDARTGQPLGESIQHKEDVRSAVFSADSTRIVTVSDKTVQLWDAHTGQPWGKPMRHEYSVWSAVLSADGTRVLVMVNGSVAQLWDARTGQPLGAAIQLKGNVDFFSAVLSGNGTHVLTASDGTARLLDARTGQPLGEPMKDVGDVTTAVFSADGTRVLTASFSGAVRLWDARTGQPLSEPMQHEWIVWSAVFSADGTRVLTASVGETVRLWDVLPVLSDSQHLLAVLAEAVGGQKLNEFGVMEKIDDLAGQLSQLRQQTAHAPLGKPTAESFVRWFLSDPWTRTISPLSKLTVPDYIQQQLAAGRREQVEKEFPGHPLLHQVQVEGTSSLSANPVSDYPAIPIPAIKPSFAE